MRTLITFALLLLISSCASSKITREYDHFLNETKTTSGTIRFIGLMSSQSMQFSQISGQKTKLYITFNCNSSSSSNLQSSSSKIAFLVNQKDRIILKCKKSEKSSLYGGTISSYISSCQYPITKENIAKLALAKEIDFRIYTSRGNKIERHLSDNDINIINSFYQNITQ